MPLKAKTIRFIALKKIIPVFVILLISAVKLFAQEKQVQGLVFDKDTKQRLTRVYIYNVGTNQGVFNNTKGEFYINASKGDTLVAALEDYSVDTATVKNGNTIIFYLKRLSIRLKQVTIHDSAKSPDRQLKEKKEEYSGAYRKGNPGDLITTGGANGLGGAGLSIDAIYNLLSREGRNARYLQEIIERDYRESIIDYRYTPKLVSSATGLQDEALKDFMQQYRPSYFFILQANDYSLIRFIQESYKAYLIDPSARRLPPLKP